MHKLLPAVIFFLLPAFHALSQPNGNYWSSIPCTVENKSDGDFLISSESKIWKAAVNPGMDVYEGYSWGREFNVRMSKAQVEWMFSDSSGYLGTVPVFDMSLMWDRGAEICHVMAFSPRRTFYHREQRWMVVKVDTTGLAQRRATALATGSSYIMMASRQSYYYTDSTNIDTGKFVQIPLRNYQLFLTKEENERRRVLIVGEVANAMHGKATNGDTIFRIVTFTADSSDILPQAPISSLLQTFKDGLMMGSLHANNDKMPEPGKWMSKMQVENSFVFWDSTNGVEDPNNPGTFILAPIKTEARNQSLLIYERWVPMQLAVNGTYGYPPQPWKSFRREVVSYGLKLSSGKVIWMDVKEVELYLREGNFSMIPYEELFRAERFRSMNIHGW